MTTENDERQSAGTSRFYNAWGAIILGWGGMLASLGWMYGSIPAEYAVASAFLGSTMSAATGHHARAMGWFSRE